MRLRKLRTAGWVAAGAIAGALLPATGASAAVFSGSQDRWPDGAYNVGRQANNPSISSVHVSYDDTAGKVVTTVTLDDSLPYGAYFGASYSLAKPKSGQTCSDSGQLLPLAHWDGSISTGQYSGSYTSIRFDPTNSGYDGSTNGYVERLSGSQYRFTVQGLQALTRQPFKCVSAVSAYVGYSNYSGGQSYESANFCLGTCPTRSVEPPPPPTSSGPAAPTRVQAVASGPNVTLTWDRSPNPDFSYFAVRRGTSLNIDLAQWTRLTSNFTSPTATDTPPGPGTYYYYVTEIDRAGRVSARSTVVRVDVLPTAPQNGGGGGGGGGGNVTTPPPVVSRPPSPAPVGGGGGTRGDRTPPTLSRIAAQRRTDIALRRAYKRAFTNGTRYRRSCRRVSSTRQSCRVSWQYKRYRYSGTVTVRARESGITSRIDVDRRKR